MEPREFLAAVVPPGLMVIAKAVPRVDAKGKAYSTFSHRCSKRIEDVVSTLLDWSAGSENAYFALASYRQGFHPSPRNPDKKQIRVRDNVEALKALWFDIDYKGGYPDAKGVVGALQGFCKATLLPAPSILVGSGNGIHAYWPLVEPVGVEQWQRLADGLKAAAKEKGLKADLACTADACRVLRLPGTMNWKDPANPKAVKVLYSSGKLFRFEDLEGILTPWFGVRRAQKQGLAADVYNELTGGVGVKTEHPPSRFDEIVKHCEVSRHIQETHGAECSEPEWMAMLQLLKFCEDRELWVHEVSNGHPGYDETATTEKFQKRMENSAGPTLCATFEQYHPALCAKCPHNGFVKTPVQLGTGEVQSAEGMPRNWRVAADGNGTERLMVIASDDGKVVTEWQRVLRHTFSGLRATRSPVSKHFDVRFLAAVKHAVPWDISFNTSILGNSTALAERMAGLGVPFIGKELKTFQDLMATWLQKLQTARRIADVAEQLGWLTTEDGTVGFSCGPTTFYEGHRTRNDVRAAREFAAIARFYEPRGTLDPWKRVAAFITEQDNPAFTAILAAAFGSPLLKFTGLPGGILSIVSTESGVGKSSVLKLSQAVWGSPTHGVNAVDDTPKSVARKLGFLNNLPAFWDELRGRKTIEDFLTLAFQVTQGKERSRLDSSAQIREVSSWETMLIVAANESIFDAMGRGTTGSDAGVVRTFEMVVAPITLDRNKAEVALMFEQLNLNYGHAGRIYAEFLANNHEAVELRIREMFKTLATVGKMHASERFWFAIMAVLLVGAEFAAKLDLCKVNTRTLAAFLMQNLTRLRSRSKESFHSTDPAEIIAQFMQSYQDRILVVDRFPALRSNTKAYLPDVSGGIPRGDKLTFHISKEDGLVRFPVNEFMRWMEFRQLPTYSTLKRLEREVGMVQMRVRLGIGTKWELPPQRCYQISSERLNQTLAAKIDDLRLDGSSRPDDSPGSDHETAP